MKPSLAAFFETMDAFFAGDASEVPGAPAERMALYARFVASHPRAMLEKNFPLTKGILGEGPWAELVTTFCLRHPPRSHEINQAAAGFPAFLLEEGPARGLPAFLPALAQFEWCDFGVYAQAVDLPQGVTAPTPNPTLQVLQHPFRMAAWVQAKAARPPAPEEGEETLLVWRHPVTHKVRFRAADPQSLLALKLAVEGIPVAVAAQEAGLGEDALWALLRRQEADGLVLLPPSP